MTAEKMRMKIQIKNEKIRETMEISNVECMRLLNSHMGGNDKQRMCVCVPYVLF